MAIVNYAAGDSRSATSMALSLLIGWQGHPPIVGDAVFIEAVDAPPDLIGPPGWTRLNNDIFWKTIMVNEPDPFFTSPAGGSIQLKAYALR
jgi:hypothetical protein